MNENFDGTDEFMDSRDITARIEEIEAEHEVWNEADALNDIDVEGMEEDEREEYEALIALRDEASHVFPEQDTFFSDDYFTEYVKDMAVDCGYISQDFPGWIEIDWEETAENVKADYTSYEFRGTTYWARD